MVVPQEQHHCHQDSRGTTSTRYRGAAGGENHPSYCCGRCCRSTCPSYQLRTRRLRMYACRKCIPFTQKAHVLGMYVEGVRDCLRVLHMCTQHTQQQVGCSSSSLWQYTYHPTHWALVLLQFVGCFFCFVCPRQQLFLLVAKNIMRMELLS